MGDLTEKEALDGLEGVVGFFRRMIPKINSLNESESRIFIITLGLYLYCKYHRYGIRKSNGYFSIYSRTMRKVYEDRALAKVAESVVNARNRIAHATWHSSTCAVVNSVINSHGLIELLKFECILDDDGKFIEPVGGKYEIADVVSAKNNDQENKDKEERSSLSDAISKMAGN